jgi:hypothetical protein
METLTAIISRKIRNSRIEETDFDHLEFGKYISDHMLVCDFAEEAWGLPRIAPYENLSLAPATLALHYGQLRTFPSFARSHVHAHSAKGNVYRWFTATGRNG